LSALPRPVVDLAAPWMGADRAVWLQSAESWLRDALREHGLAPCGAIEWVRESHWSIVLRTSTSGGFVYFKASSPCGRHEAGVMSELARDWSDRVPAPLAVDETRGWMVLGDHGRTLAEASDGRDDLEVWLRLLPRYAEMQIASCFHVARWERLGVPDRRLALLPRLLADLLRDEAALALGWPGGLAREEHAMLRALVPEFGRCCRELGAVTHSTALDHGDLHAGNVLRDEGGDRFFDWGDASLTHPFASLLPVCEMLVTDYCSGEGRGRIARLRDAYLEPWSKVSSAPSLRAHFAAALWVAHVGRALSWSHALRDAGPVARLQWGPLVARWLRLWLKRRQLLMLD
jgi:phosphotransferase family enzyme